jgi:ZIP family zinc transporter
MGAALLLLPFPRGPGLAGVAGLMVFISLDELLPAVREHGGARVATLGASSGMAVSLWLLRV